MFQYIADRMLCMTHINMGNSIDNCRRIKTLRRRAKELWWIAGRLSVCYIQCTKNQFEAERMAHSFVTSQIDSNWWTDGTSSMFQEVRQIIQRKRVPHNLPQFSTETVSANSTSLVEFNLCLRDCDCEHLEHTLRNLQWLFVLALL